MRVEDLARTNSEVAALDRLREITGETRAGTYGTIGREVGPQLIHQPLKLAQMFRR